MADEEKKYIQPNYQGQYDQKVKDLYSRIENQPKPQSQYDSQVDDLYKQISARNPFSFNADNDALYQQYVDRYMQGGRQAMKDTVGQASALTGGYSNSYAQNVGQQAYDQYLTGLNDEVKDLYQMQMQAYQLEGDRLNNLLGMASGLADRDYARANDEYDRLGNLLGTAATLADSDYNRLFNEAQMRQGLGDDSLMRQLLGMPAQQSSGGGGGRYSGDDSLYKQYLDLKSDLDVSAGQINDWLVNNADGLSQEGYSARDLLVLEKSDGRAASQDYTSKSGRKYIYSD